MQIQVTGFRLQVAGEIQIPGYRLQGAGNTNTGYRLQVSGYRGIQIQVTGCRVQLPGIQMQVTGDFSQPALKMPRFAVSPKNNR
jgi:hypothetical protein